MVSGSINDRTAVWQAAHLYYEEYETSNPGPELEEVRSAFERWQEADRSLNEGYWVWNIDEAKIAAEAALEEMLGPSRTSTSGSVRKRREKWMSARQHVAELQASHLEAQERASTTLEEYVRVLKRHY